MSDPTYPTAEAYKSILEPHRRAMVLFELEFGFFLRDVGQLNIFSVTCRTKEFRKATIKAAQLAVAVAELDDLAGLRIVVGTRAEVPIVERFFTMQEYCKDIEILKNQRIERDSGYRATHLVAVRNASYKSSVFPGRVEIQIHTIFEHAYNFLSRNWSYKQSWQTTGQWSKDFAELSRLLAKLDAAAESLHVQLTPLKSSTDSDALSPHSLQRLIKEEFGEDEPLVDCVDACRRYVDLGCKTNGNLRAHFRDTRVMDLYEINKGRTTNSDTLGPLGGMSKYMFWSIFGIKVDTPGIKEFFVALPPDV